MTTVTDLATDDLIELTGRLVDVPSVSFHEAALVGLLEAELRAVEGLEVIRLGDNLVARTQLGRDRRLVLAGHTDTVPPQGNEGARRDADGLAGVGSADMKGGLAVMLHLARTVGAPVAGPAVDLTWVFYAREEVAQEHSGLAELVRERPDLVAGDAAILGEPTGGAVEAGCQGTLRLVLHLAGAAAHTARPWMGRNALHRLGALLATIEGAELRRPVIDGCEFRESLQAVAVRGGAGGNVVPDAAELVVNHRFAPDRSGADAEAWVRGLLAPHLDDGDRVELEDLAEGALPGLDQPLLGVLSARHGLEVRAKLGWTDVARFTSIGVPAVNLGPGDPTLAHHADERLDTADLTSVAAVLEDLVVHGA